MHGRRSQKSSFFFPNRGGAVVEHCRKYTVGYGAWRGSRPMHCLWLCGDRAGVLAAPAGGVAVLGESIVPHSTWRRSEGPAGGGPALVKVGAASEDRAHAVRGFRGGESTREVRGFGSTVAGAVPSTSRTASQVPIVSPQRRGWHEQ